MDTQLFYQQHPQLAELKRHHRFTFFVLSQCMPPRPAQISKTELYKLGENISALWKKIPSSTRSDYTKEVIKAELFVADPVLPRFISMTLIGDQYKPIVAVEFRELIDRGRKSA